MTLPWLIKTFKNINPIKPTVGLMGLALLALLWSCTGKRQAPQAPAAKDYTQVTAPAPCADSAMAFATAQLAFGPRIPGSRAAAQCRHYIASNMARWVDTVIMQPFGATLWDGTEVRGTNIIASLNPQAPQRVLLAAHYDSRLWADHDPDPNNQHSPVPGANDGASGSALLMEMARVMSQMPPSVGVDFIFFDLEDQGTPDWADNHADNTWCKGSQHWGQTPHTPFYKAQYGILLDMVGSHQPRFTKEEISRHFAPGLTDKVWQVAAAIGHGAMFVQQNTDPILDDHLYINQLTGIPTIDLVQNSPECSFFTHWHTTSDNLDALDPRTLEAVARVVLTTIYADYPQ
ncbi:MAG: M28 family peptidase [Bacteroidales bacterium]|nr:M28 family peptidase [Bacteroidales bacterium]